MLHDEKFQCSQTCVRHTDSQGFNAAQWQVSNLTPASCQGFMLCFLAYFTVQSLLFDCRNKAVGVVVC